MTTSLVLTTIIIILLIVILMLLTIIYSINKKNKYCCGPYEYIFKKEDYDENNKIIVPNWCGNKKRDEE